MTTSRVGRKPVEIPSGTDVKLQGNVLSAKGPKGNLNLTLHPFVSVAINENQITVALNAKDEKITGIGQKTYRSIAGTTRANIGNLITGVSNGFERKLQLVGVGYRAQSKGKVLALNLGFSHPTEFNVPEGVTVETPTPTEILIKGSDKQLVGETAAKIRSIRKPEPYKGKGVRYADEVIVLKETKKK